MVVRSLLILLAASATSNDVPPSGPTPLMIHRTPAGLELYFLAERPGEANGYAIIEPAARQAAVVDPGSRNGQWLRDWLKKQSLDVAYVLITHAHADHLGGLEGFLRDTSAVVVIHRVEFDRLPDSCKSYRDRSAPERQRFLFRTDEQVIEFGGVRLRTILIPGHTLASLAYEWVGQDIVFTGDTLFRGSVGRTDGPGAAGEACLIAYIRAGLLTLDDRTRVLPGHGPFTTIGRERMSNPFLVCLGNPANAERTRSP
jgi:glyoxylase-like metal-dependent hydrolase (beta-lactamase superfamily II)